MKTMNLLAKTQIHRGIWIGIEEPKGNDEDLAMKIGLREVEVVGTG